MPLADRDRKLLWARAGGVCTLCKSHLTVDAKDGDKDVVVGEEAHIVSEQPNGPRFRPMPRKEVDSYTNLLLLCLSDHKMIDEQTNYFTEQRLLELKQEHEQWVKDRISSTPPAIKIRNPEADKPVMLKRIDTGKELMEMVVHTLAAHHDNPEPRSREEAELIGAFFQDTSDYIDAWDYIEPKRHIQAEFEMSAAIARLREAELLVYAGVKNHIIDGGVKAPATWPVAHIIIYRKDDETIKARSEDIDDIL
ncbi:hypothetical protein [Dictyobacter formicarum]|uniref:HNH endonuclease n=1 Tax=Dictyobacter formicarum TaxID=2778368 RepID=A0ABQ3VE13_9CHLR|nr:hypothetical protein [Dictyobacter formicarum]GHO83979.1 hypothetical protein KSZ_19850 [Dictyobacter formicarum]